MVVSRAGALPEVVGDAGRQFEPESPAELKEHLREVLADAPCREVMIRKGLRRAQELSWERSAEAALATFQELVGDHAA